MMMMMMMASVEDQKSIAPGRLKGQKAKERQSLSLIINLGLRCYLMSPDKILINSVVRRSSSMRVKGFLNKIALPFLFNFGKKGVGQWGLGDF